MTSSTSRVHQRKSTLIGAIRRRTCLSCNVYVSPVLLVPTAIFAGCSPRSLIGMQISARCGGRGNEPRRCLLRFAPSHSIKMRDSVIEYSGLIVPPPAARKSPFSAAIFLRLLSPSSSTTSTRPPYCLPTLALLLRMFFNRPNVFFLGGWRANCRGRHMRNLRYGNSLRF